MYGNRRYAKKKLLELDGAAAGHDAGVFAPVLICMYCYELGVKYKLDLLTTIVNRFAPRVHSTGNLELSSTDLRDATKKLMELTADYLNSVLTICIAYTSTDEISHAIQESCEEKWNDQKLIIKLVDLVKHMYMAIAPDPDIVIRTGG
ncbi:hypothetical protein CRYUN_Cryun19dG0018900 [Craigia yunnanensis]